MVPYVDFDSSLKNVKNCRWSVLQVVADLVAQRAASSSSCCRIMSLKDLLQVVVGLDQLLAAEGDITGCISDDGKSGVGVVSFRGNVIF